VSDQTDAVAGVIYPVTELVVAVFGFVDAGQAHDDGAVGELPHRHRTVRRT